ncbi:MAG TPA: hypothetical protein VIG33_10335, partial [Pseudobdellovibrionaceae bacterium]
MSLKKLFILTMCHLFCQYTFAGFVVGNGGDAILCQKNSDNSLEGFYSLDYILTLADKKGDDGLTPVTSWN